MALRLPRLETTVDCKPIGYPGVEVTFWLNPPNVDLEEEVADSYGEGEPWATAYYHAMARQFERVTITGKYTSDGEDEVIEIADAKALWDLERRPDFDPHILLWSMNWYANQRSERMRLELGN